MQRFATNRETPPNCTAYNRQQFFMIVQGLGGFRALATEIGAANAEAVANLIFDAEVREANPADRYISIAAEKLADYRAGTDRSLLIERDQIVKARDYVTLLLKATMAGRLRNNLEEMADPQSNYVAGRSLPAVGTREREIALASYWVSSSMHGAASDAVRECLTRHVLTKPFGLALGRTPGELLDKVHAEIAADAPRVRSPNSATAYPSSVGGRFVLEQVFKWTSKIIWPGPGEEIWQDVALFYLGAIATAQGYADANKRAARMAYAITLLKAELPFVAPNMSLQSALVQMEHRGDG